MLLDNFIVGLDLLLGECLLFIINFLFSQLLLKLMVSSYQFLMFVKHFLDGEYILLAFVAQSLVLSYQQFD